MPDSEVLGVSKNRLVGRLKMEGTGGIDDEEEDDNDGAKVRDCLNGLDLLGTFSTEPSEDALVVCGVEDNPKRGAGASLKLADSEF